MKIAVSSTSKIPSETANSIQVLMVCQGLIQNGHEIRLWVPELHVKSFESLRKSYGLTCKSFKIHTIPSFKWLNRWEFSILSISRAFFWNADLVYTWTIQIALLAAIAGETTVFEVHDIPSGKLGTRCFRSYIRSDTSKRLVFISHELKNQVQAKFPDLKNEDCVIASNGVELEDYQNLPDSLEAKKQLGYPETTIVSCSGHLYAGRGTDLFLELAKRFPQINFYWFGGNPEQVEFYRSEARNRSLENVVFTGFIPKSELPLAQAASDILIMPYGKKIAGSSGGDSAAICSPMKLFEYLAAGKPILSSDLPVIHEILNSNNALFCEPDNPDSWAEGLTKLLNDPNLRESLSAAALKESQKYSWQKRAESIISFMSR
jgi:glycosyltransferase involved in cell wall biosynthesis